MGRTNAAIKARENKIRAIEYLGGKCLHCGIIDDQAIYDFHHIDPTTKEHNIATLRNLKFEKMIAELQKCILLCSNCHRKEHCRLRDLAIIQSPPISKPPRKKKSRPVFLCACGQAISKRSKSCLSCSNKRLERTPSKIVWPAQDKMKEMVWKMPASSLARLLGVSDVSIHRWCKRRSIETPPPGYWALISIGVSREDALIKLQATASPTMQRSLP